MKSENPAGDGAQAADQVKIASSEFTASPTRTESPTCPFCKAPLFEPDCPVDHEDWCRNNHLAGGRSR